MTPYTKRYYDLAILAIVEYLERGAPRSAAALYRGLVASALDPKMIHSDVADRLQESSVLTADDLLAELDAAIPLRWENKPQH